MKTLKLQKRGQSLVEFVLMIAFVAGIVSVLRTQALPQITRYLESQKDQANSRAWKGGEQDLRIFYRNGCGKKGAC